MSAKKSTSKAARLAFWRVRLADYQPVGAYGEDAEFDHTPPTMLEMIALGIAHTLVMGYWINRNMLWGEGGNYSELVKEIAAAMLTGLRREYSDMHHLDMWLELERRELLPAAKGGDDASAANANA